MSITNAKEAVKVSENNQFKLILTLVEEMAMEGRRSLTFFEPIGEKCKDELYQTGFSAMPFSDDTKDWHEITW